MHLAFIRRSIKAFKHVKHAFVALLSRLLQCTKYRYKLINQKTIFAKNESKLAQKTKTYKWTSKKTVVGHDSRLDTLHHSIQQLTLKSLYMGNNQKKSPIRDIFNSVYPWASQQLRFANRGTMTQGRRTDRQV